MSTARVTINKEVPIRLNDTNLPPLVVQMHHASKKCAAFESAVAEAAKTSTLGIGHPSETLLNPPQAYSGTARKWAMVGIYGNHPLITMILSPNDEIRGVWLDAATKWAQNVSTKVLSNGLVREVNTNHTSLFSFIPKATADVVLPKMPRELPEADAQRHKFQNVRIVPVYILPFMRKFLHADHVHDFDRQMDLLAVILSMEIPAQGEFASLRGVHAQFLANMLTTRMSQPMNAAPTRLLERTVSQLAARLETVVREHAEEVGRLNHKIERIEKRLATVSNDNTRKKKRARQA